MATKTPNFNLSKAELTDAIQSTILANNENFDIIDEALKGSGGDCNIPKFIGTEENPIDFSNLFEGIGNETDGWYQGTKIGQCILQGYVKGQLDSVESLASLFTFDMSDFVMPEATAENFEMIFTYIYCVEYGMETIYLINNAGNKMNMILAFPGSGFVYAGTNELAYSDSVLTKDNTTEYTPTEDYHPATKKYVDENGGGGSTTYTLPTVGESQTIETLYGDYTLTTKEVSQKTTVKSIPVSENGRFPSITTGEIDYYDDTKWLSKSAFNITLGSETKTISFGENEGQFNDGDDTSLIFQEKIDAAFGAGQIEVNFIYYDWGCYSLEFKCKNNKLILSTLDEESKRQLESDFGYELGDTLSILGIESGITNEPNISISIADFLGTVETELTLTINNYSTTVNTTLAIVDLFETVNNADNNIEIKYMASQGAFTISDVKSEITITDTLGLFDALGFTANAMSTQIVEDIYIASVTNPDGMIKKVQLVENAFNNSGVLALLTILQKEYEEKINDLEKKINEILLKLEGGVS